MPTPNPGPVPLVDQQVLATLENFKAEVAAHGLTEVADEMWNHAMRLRRAARLTPPLPLEDRP